MTDDRKLALILAVFVLWACGELIAGALDPVAFESDSVTLQTQ